MPLTREQAWDQLCSWTESEALRIHARSVEVVMRAAAYKYGNGESELEAWGIAGLLHDADYEQWPDEHPNRTVACCANKARKPSPMPSPRITRNGMSRTKPP